MKRTAYSIRGICEPTAAKLSLVATSRTAPLHNFNSAVPAWLAPLALSAKFEVFLSKGAE